MRRRTPRFTRTDTRFPYTTLFRSAQPTGRSGLGKDDALADRGGQHRHRLRDGFAQRIAQLAPDQGAHDAAGDDERRPQTKLEYARIVAQRDDLARRPEHASRQPYRSNAKLRREGSNRTTGSSRMDEGRA